MKTEKSIYVVSLKGPKKKTDEVIVRARDEDLAIKGALANSFVFKNSTRVYAQVRLAHPVLDLRCVTREQVLATAKELRKGVPAK